MEFYDNWNEQLVLAQRVMIAGTDLQTIVDASGAPATTYVGQGAFGLAQSASGWLITLITVSGTTTTVQHNIGGIWNNRAGLVYQ